MEDAEKAIKAQKDFDADDLYYLSEDRIPVEWKLSDFQSRLKSSYVQANPIQQKHVRNLMAGVVVFERLNQARRWFAIYSRFPVVEGEIRPYMDMPPLSAICLTIPMTAPMRFDLN